MNQAKPKTRKFLIALLSVSEVLLLVIIAVLGYYLLRLWRVNQYSKNIWLDHNYFLADYDTDTETVSELLAEKAETSMEEPAIEDFLDQINYYTSIGLLPPWASEENVFACKEAGLQQAYKVANEYLGEEYFRIEQPKQIIDVPSLSQEEFPNGCEAVSATMLLQFYQYNVSAADFIDRYLDMGEVSIKWGCRYGPDPKMQYAGNPRSERGGWGCFAPVIAKSLNKVLTNKDYAYNLTGTSLDRIAQDYVSNGIPVAVWVTVDMQEINEVYQWQAYDSEETFLYPSKQHCMVLIGFDETTYYFNDPKNPGSPVQYDKDKVKASYNSMGRQAIVILNGGLPSSDKNRRSLCETN